MTRNSGKSQYIASMTRLRRGTEHLISTPPFSKVGDLHFTNRVEIPHQLMRDLAQ